MWVLSPFFFYSTRPVNANPMRLTACIVTVCTLSLYLLLVQSCTRQKKGIHLAGNSVFRKGNLQSLPRTSSIPIHKEVLIASKEMETNKALSSSTARNTLLFCAVIYGYSYVSLKMLQNAVQPEIVLILRFFLGSAMFLPNILRFKGDLSVIVAGLEMGLWCMLGFLAQSVGLKHASASKASLLSSLGVILPPIFNYIEYKLFSSKKTMDIDDKEKKAAIRQNLVQSLQPAVLAVLGAAVLEWGGIEPPSWVDLLLLVTPFSFAMCFYRSEKFAVKFPKHTQTLTGVMLLSVTFYSLFWALCQGVLPTSSNAWQVLGQSLQQDKWFFPLLIFQGLVATGWTALSEQEALKVLSASETSLIYTLEPIFAAGFAYLFLHEHIGWNTLLGAVMIIAACAVGGKH